MPETKDFEPTCCCSFTEEQPQYQKLDSFIKALAEKKRHLVTVLHKAQSLFGYLHVRCNNLSLARWANLSPASTALSASIPIFTMVPRGKYPISICMGTACFVKEAEIIVDAFKQQLKIELGEVSFDGLFSIDTVRCVGACGLAPIVLVGEKVFGNVTIAQVPDIIAEFSSPRSTAA